jgi:hypothetical protein
MFEIGAGQPIAAPPAEPPEAPGASSFGDVSGVVLAHLLAPTLANLDEVPEGLEGDALMLEAAVGLTRLESWAVSARMRVLATLERRQYAEMSSHGMVAHHDSRGTTAWASHRFDDARLAHRSVSTEVSLATGITAWAADRDLDLAAGLALHPALADALARGRIDRRRVEFLLAETAVLDGVGQDRVVASVVGDGTHACDHPDPEQRPGAHQESLIRPLRRAGARLLELQPAVLRRAVRHAVEATDPEAGARRESVARAARRAEHRPLPDATGEILIVGPAVEVGAAFAAVDDRARTLRRGGDQRNLDQLRCDVALGQLSNGAFGVPPAEGRAGESSPSTLVVISMNDHTALALDDRPATMHGPGGPEPLPAEVAREIAYDPEQATWLALYRHPQTGIATDVSARYRPPRRMRTFVRLRDGLQSRLPIEGGQVTEIDHVVPYRHDDPNSGGTTTPAQLETLGLRGHHLKTDGILAVSGDANGALVFRTRTGHEYVSWPEDWRDEHELGPPLKPTG